MKLFFPNKRVHAKREVLSEQQSTFEMLKFPSFDDLRTAGVNVLAENDTPSFILVNAIFLLGTFTFAVVLGVVSDDIGNELKVR